MSIKRKKRVLVGMSGGVDSSVTAALLKKRGYEVIGITMQMLPKETEHQSACCNIGSINDAKRVASKLNIPHYTINIRDTFQKNVISNFVNTYLSGSTPNPCVECNRHIKFDELLKKAEELDADYIATGHYSKITYSPKTKQYRLCKAKDDHKDQSYFLYMMSSNQLSKTLFPLGKYHKSEVRKMAEQFNLLNANKPDSQEICFVTSKSYTTFIDKYLSPSNRKPGLIKNLNGQVLGKHTGIHQFTVGQRKGLGIDSNFPLYVLKINAQNHDVVVGDKEDLPVLKFSISKFSLIDQNEDVLHKSFDLKIRYQMTPIKATITAICSDKATVSLVDKTPLIAPGQSAVFYEKDRIIGGGIIEKPPL
ncbi:MAG: tRNA 2-thiouridine(34) synthase MnmA [Candidatus Margulisbacteria bacterium]|nr:tRNA 2-thiouridine(34) synthase MnmA [Candidatus Margulisiibacteriota bacterium]